MSKTFIHVNRHRLMANRKHGTHEPVVTVLAGKERARYADEVLIHDKKGRIVARVIYRPEKPLSCGALAWVETYHPVTLVEQLEEMNP